MNAEYALAEAIGTDDDINQERQRERTAALEGHDADIPTESQPTTSTETFATPTPHVHPISTSHPPSIAPPDNHNATVATETQSLSFIADAFSNDPERPSFSIASVPGSSSLASQGKPTRIPLLDNDNLPGLAPCTASGSAASSRTSQDQHSIPLVDIDSLPGLAPSTISQWVPESDSSAQIDSHNTTSGTIPAILSRGRSSKSEKALILEAQKRTKWNASGIASGYVTEASSAVPNANSSIEQDTMPGAASGAATSGAIASAKPEAVPAPGSDIAQSSSPEAKLSTDATAVLAPASELATSSVPQVANDADPEKKPASTGPPNGNGSPRSSNLEEKVDLEAGHASEDSKKEDPGTTSAEVDPNIVDWDGPDDPKNPVNWSKNLKWANVAVIASITFLTPLASSMLAPAVPEVMTEFKSNNQELGSFVVSVYILGYAFGPLALAPLSELYGRVPLYHACNILFIVFTVACAVSSNLNMLIGWRFLQGTFGSCPLTIGGGTITDMIVQQKRGGVMAIWALGPLMGPVIGPVAGGYLGQAKGWRWLFWVLAMAAGVITISSLFSLRESYPPVLLERKAKRLRKETGNRELRSKLASPLSPAALFKLSIIRPLKLLLFSPIVLALSTYMAVVYGYLYLLFTTITEVYEGQYHFGQGTVGLTYLGIGVGCLIGVIIFGVASDKILQAKSKNGEMKAEYRLPPMIPGSFVIPIGLFLYGWTAEKHVFWLAPIVGTGLVGVGLLATFMPIQTYLVDAFTIYAASALAANTVLRSLVGALLPLAGQRMYDTLGLGWGNSLLAFIAIAMCPIPVIFYRYGERIRKNPKFQVKL